MSAETRRLTSNLSTLNQGLGELRRSLDTVVKVLTTAENLLLIPKRVAEVLKLLNTALLALKALLTALSAVPYVGPVAKALEQVVSPIQRMVGRASSQANKIEARIEPQREKVSEFRDKFERVVAPLRKLNDFVSKELGLLEATTRSNESLPDSRYKQGNQNKIEAMSAQLVPLTEGPLALVSDATSRLRSINNAMESVNSLCDEVGTFINPIMNSTRALDDQTKQIKPISRVLDQRIGVPPLAFTVSEALGLLGGGLPPGLDDLAKSLVKPFLNKMKSIPGVPPVLQIIPLLMSAADTLGSANRLNALVDGGLGSLTTEQNVESTFKSVRP